MRFASSRRAGIASAPTVGICKKKIDQGKFSQLQALIMQGALKKSNVA